MSRSSPFVVTLSDSERAELTRRSRCCTLPHEQVVRAKIVLLAADGVSNTAIAERVDVHVDVVSRWRKRFCEQRLDGLSDRKRSGRPRVFAAEVVAEVKAMACQPPEQRQVPLSRWSSAELAAQAVTDGLVESVSASTVRRWLAEDAIQPWRYRSSIFPRDPNFAVKAGRVLDLYERVWDGIALGADEYVISADEKSQLQALSRCHPELAPAPGRPAGRVRVRPARDPGLFRRLRRASRTPERADRTEYRDRPVHRAGRAGDDHRALRDGETGVLDCGFTRTDLIELCRRIDAHRPANPVLVA